LSDIHILTSDTVDTPLRWKVQDSEIAPEAFNRSRESMFDVIRSGQIAEYAADMLKAMHNLDGIGLAANQLGINERIFVTDFMSAMNPTIIQAQYYKDVNEGCLSLPGTTVKIGRARKIKVKYFDIDDWTEKSNVFVDEQAHVIQHEIDHLNGILCIDYGNVLTGR